MFNMCAVSDSGCVPQKPDEGEYKPPAEGSTVKELNTGALEGRWYIVAGLNSEFDCYDCQVHYFASPEPGTLYGKLNWRVSRPNGQFYQRSDIQSFEQDENKAGELYNWYNAFLHYSDNWYVLADKPDQYFLVYYTGSNDAVENYGGAVLYSRKPYLDPEIVPEVRQAIERANIGYTWNDFKLTDNTCGPEPKPKFVPPTDLDTAADDVKALEENLVSFGPGVTTFRSALSEQEKQLEKEFQSDLKKAEKEVEKIEKQYKPVFGSSNLWSFISTYLPGF
jgi:violaxanthin de-epoxidase